jgi:hypothetical protein
MNIYYREMNDDTQLSHGRPKDGDAGSGEIFFGVMSLGFSLVGYLSTRWGIDGLLPMAAVLVPAWGIGYWSSLSIQRRYLQPRIGRATPDIQASARTLTGHEKYRWTLIALMALTSVVAACVAVLASRSNLEDTRESIVVSILSIGMFFVLVGAYGFWIVFNGQQGHVWKWMLMASMAIGFVVVGLWVHADIFTVWTEVALLNGIAWLGSGLATLYFYARRSGSPDVGPE